MKTTKIFLLLAVMMLSLNSFAQKGLNKGDIAPSFKNKDQSGKEIELKTLLKENKAVVLFFYRGQWCPFCNKQIKELQDSLQLLTNKGAYVVGVTPETAENINKTIDKTHASFSIIEDKGYKIIKAYDVNFVVEPELVTKYKTYGIDLVKNNGNNENVLPVPATYVIDKSGKIKYVHFDKNYKKRASVADIVKALD